MTNISQTGKTPMNAKPMKTKLSINSLKAITAKFLTAE